MKIEYHIEDFIDYCVERNLSRKTYGSYEQTLRLFARYLKDIKEVTEVEKVTKEHIRDYIGYIRERGKYTSYVDDNSRKFNFPENREDYGKKVSDVTINNYIRNIKVFFNYLTEQREIRKNPAKGIKEIKVARKPLYYLADWEYRQLLNSMDISKTHEYRDYIIINLLMDTGMRVGECLATEVVNLDFKDRTILLPSETTKGKKSRYVFFSQKMGRELKNWLQYKDRYLESDYLFPSIRNTMLQVGNFETNLRKYAKKAGLTEVHPHVFRNNFAKRFLTSGGDIYTLSRILGHSSVEVTEAAYMDLDVIDLRKMYDGHSPLSNMGRRG